MVMRFYYYPETLTAVKVDTDFSLLRFRFESQRSTHGICGAQSVYWTVFFLVLRFSHVSFHNVFILPCIYAATTIQTMSAVNTRLLASLICLAPPACKQITLGSSDAQKLKVNGVLKHFV
jgi:hypothetical protein